jgi:hypothetical protein
MEVMRFFSDTYKIIHGLIMQLLPVFGHKAPKVRYIFFIFGHLTYLNTLFVISLFINEGVVLVKGTKTRVNGARLKVNGQGGKTGDPRLNDAFGQGRRKRD